jgi:tetratricopeptide (TPR) repeat protein
VDLESAELAGDTRARTAALEALARATPADPAVWAALAQAAVVRRAYSQGLECFARVTAIQPEDAALLNIAGYTAAYAGDLDRAIGFLRRYQALRPGDANPLDSMGDVNLYLGHPAEAAEYYVKAYAKAPAFNQGGALYKAAVARLITGDVAAADALAKQFVEAREAAGDPLAEFRKAEWSWLSGRRKAGLERLAAVAAARAARPGEIGARAWVQMALWKLELGDSEGARQAAGEAVKNVTASSAGLAGLAQFLTAPPASASEWAVRAERTFPGEGPHSLKRLARVYALLVAREFPAALPLLREMYAAWNPTLPNTELPVLLAWACVETGNAREAAPLVRFTPIPDSSGLSAFTSFWFPRLFYLRGAIDAGQRRRQFDLFLKLSGPDPLLWGEEARARPQ